MITVEVIGRDTLDAGLESLARAAADARPWDEHKRLRFSEQTRHMDTRGSGSWPPLKASTLARKERDPQASFREILQRTGQLYFSLTREGAAFNVTDERPDGLDMGTADPKARLHHTGRGRLPVRAVIEPTEGELDRHAELFFERKGREALAAGFEAE